MISIAENKDCMEAMKEFPDKYFDLLVADPPYGDGCSQSIQVERERESRNRWTRFGGRFDRYKSLSDWRDLGNKVRKKIVSWDHAPGDDVFKEMFRVSKNQIIWGGNYFSLPPTRCFVVWDKQSIAETFTMAMAEYAWCSFGGNAKIWRGMPSGQKDRFHPTQKPIELYEWLLRLYAKPGYKILDPFLGSGSSRIAAYNGGYDFWGYEIDKEYFDKQEERYAKHISQERIDLPFAQQFEQTSIFY